MFDGQGNTISGLFLNSTDDGIGLFTNCNGDILNLKITNAYVKGENQVGGICSSFTKVGGNFKNNSFEGTIRGNSSVGGLIGVNSCSNISGCINRGNIWADGSYVGGIVGHYSAYGIDNCINEGSIHAEGDYVGGITSESDIYGIQNCKNNGSITGRNNVGGIVGEITEGVYVSNCGNTESVSGEKYVGGIVGTAAKDIYVNAITNCYNASPIDGSSNVGGIVGYAEYVDLEYNYNVGNISGNDNIGAVAGKSESIWGRGKVSNCCYLKTDGINTDITGLGNTSDSEDTVRWRKSGYFPILTAPTADSSYSNLGYRNGETDDPLMSDEEKEDSPTDSLIPNKLIKIDGINYYVIQNINQWDYVAEQKGDWLKYNYALESDLVINSVVLTCDASGNLQNDISELTEIIPWDGFEGVFDGQGNTISGLFLNSTDDDVGLFTNCNGDILNLNITNAYVKGANRVGGICSSFRKVGGNIKNNSFEGTVFGNNNVGGLIGGNSCSNISGCINRGNVWAEEGHAGGIVGYYYAYGIDNCINEGSVHAKGDYVGGITSVSSIYGIQNCRNNGSITGRNIVGGIVGEITEGVYVSNCGNTESVSGEKYVGGIVGTAAKDIYVNAITNCYNASPIDGSSNVGGIVGYAEYADVLSDNNVGNVTGINTVGAICGASEAIWGKGKISDCIFLSNSSINSQLQGLGNGTTSSEEVKAISDDTYCGIDVNGKILYHKGTRMNAVPATCTSAGTTGTLICTRCGRVLEESNSIPEKGHSWDNETTIDRQPTCTAPGQKSIHCKVCGTIKDGTLQPVPALGHNFGDWHVVRNATTNMEGLEERVCNRDGATEQRSISKLPVSVSNITISKAPSSVKAKSSTKGKVKVSWKKIKKTKKTKLLLKKIEISPLADRNEQLGEIYDYLDQLKEALSDIVYDMDAEDETEAETVNTLTDALEQIDDALDAIADVME